MPSSFRIVDATAAVLLATICFSGISARADVTHDAAVKQFDEGVAAFNRQDYSQALALFQASLEALPSPNTRIYVAQCYKALGKFGSAYSNYLQVQREANERKKADPRFGETYEAAVKEATAIAGKVSHLSLRWASEQPASPRVTLDGAEIAANVVDALNLDAGSHVIVVSALRWSRFERTVALQEGEHAVVDVSLRQLATGRVTLRMGVRPAGFVAELDGAPLDPATLGSERDVDAGPHEVVVRAPGYRDFTWSRTVRAGEARDIDVKLVPVRPGPPHWVTYSVAAGSVVALGIASVLAIDATATSHGEQQKDPLLRDPQRQEQIRTQAVTANVLFAVGAGLAGAAGILAYLSNWRQPQPGDVSLWWTVTPDGGSVGASRRF